MPAQPPDKSVLNASAAQPRPEVGNATDPEYWVDRHGDYLYSYAMMRLRDVAAAQDVVQETFVAALKNLHHYRSDSDLRGWLLGILKHKVLDRFRHFERESLFTDLESYERAESEAFVEVGAQAGAWIRGAGPTAWAAEPELTLDRKEFWATLQRCTDRLPAAVAQAFWLREVDGQPGVEIQKALGVTESNLWVMLHRARMALRRCLEVHWFHRAVIKRPAKAKPMEGGRRS